MIHVPPDGPAPCKIAVCGEAPAEEEVRQGRGFCGPSGALLWPLMLRLAYLNREDCYVTNLCKHPLDNDVAGELKLEEWEFESCRKELYEELGRVRPMYVLAVGALAAKALLGSRYTTMEACNGIGFGVIFGGAPAQVIPTWHPAAALRPGGEDKLSFTAAAIAALVKGPALHPDEPAVPAPLLVRNVLWGGYTGSVGLDTEGIPEDPICMTVATPAHRYYVEPVDVPGFFATLPTSLKLLFFNAPWDWRVLWAMGAPRDIATRWQWADPSELAYLANTEPRNLKDLSYRHLGLRMPTFEETVLPHFDATVRAIAEGRILAGTTTVTHSPKTGKLLKRPKVTLAPDVKPLHRALANPKLLAERVGSAMPWERPAKHQALSSVLRVVPFAQRVQYSTLDAWATVMLEPKLRAVAR